MVVLNGRSQSDPEGDYTFVSHVGRSCPDHVWIDTTLVSELFDFEIHDIGSNSDHFVCWVTFGGPFEGMHERESFVLDRKLLWNPEKVDEYKAIMASMYAEAQGTNPGAM